MDREAVQNFLVKHAGDKMRGRTFDASVVEDVVREARRASSPLPTAFAGGEDAFGEYALSLYERRCLARAMNATGESLPCRRACVTAVVDGDWVWIATVE
jgi:hypothetical protein